MGVGGNVSGHLAMECFVGKGGKQYDILPELEDMVPSDLDTPSPEKTQSKRKKVSLIKIKRR